jgi:hypothetical protein
MLILQQPHSHIPLYEADYKALKLKKELRHTHKTPRTHLASSPRAAARLTERLRFKLPVQVSATIIHHNQRVNHSVSVTPFDSSFPVLARTRQIHVLFSVSPFDARFPAFRARRVDRTELRPLIDSDELEVTKSFTPFDQHFPSTAYVHRAPGRRLRNKSAIKRRRLEAAVAQYRRERGPVAERLVYDAAGRNTKSVDPSIVSFSPWQEAEFAVFCSIPLPKFVAAKNIKAVTVKACELLKPKLMKVKSPRYMSYSPFSPMFPNIGKPVVAKKVVATSAIVPVGAFPAYSPMAKQQTEKTPGFNLPAATQAKEKTPARQPSLHMH